MRALRTAAALSAAAIGLAALALWRSDIPFAALRARYAGPDSRFLRLPDGTLLHVRDIGRRDGPVLLCLHGYSASSLDWLPWAHALATDARLLLVDLPGHGLTEAPAHQPHGTDAMASAVVALTGVLGLDKVVLVGNSMGGQVALTAALAMPERVAGLVLIAPTGAIDLRASAPPSPLFRLLASKAGRWVLRHLDLTMLVRRGLRDALGDPAMVTDDLVARTAALARAPGHRAILTELQLAPGGEPLLGRLGALRQPALVIAGEADRLVPVSASRAIAAALPASRLVVYDGVGHVPMLTTPARCAADVRDWLETAVR